VHLVAFTIGTQNRSCVGLHNRRGNSKYSRSYLDAGPLGCNAVVTDVSKVPVA